MSSAKKLKRRLDQRQKDYDRTLTGKSGYKRPGSNKK